MSNPAKTKEPVKPKKKMVYIRLDMEVWERIDRLAKLEQRDWSFVASRILDRGSQAS